MPGNEQASYPVQHLRQTLTVDNGKEFSNFKELEAKTGLKVYFANPYAAWQRGTNENTNGLLRQYFPKGTDFRSIPEKDIAFIVKKLNNRPGSASTTRRPMRCSVKLSIVHLEVEST